MTVQQTIQPTTRAKSKSNTTRPRPRIFSLRNIFIVLMQRGMLLGFRDRIEAANHVK